jgi:hypothetical protein
LASQLIRHGTICLQPFGPPLRPLRPSLVLACPRFVVALCASSQTFGKHPSVDLLCRLRKFQWACIGLPPTDPYKRFWYARKFSSKSTLGNGGEETHHSWSSNTVIAELDAKLESKLDSSASLMKSLPTPGSRTTHISSLKKYQL